MTTYLALYRGDTPATVSLVATTTNPALITVVAEELLNETTTPNDPVLAALNIGRRAALEAISKTGEEACL